MLKCIIIDDEQHAIDSLLRHIKLIPSLETVSVYMDPLEALRKISGNSRIDIIFMDIDMPNLSGIELAKELRSKTDKLIFTTAYSKYAFDAYEVNGDAFLLKPFSFAKFSTTIYRLYRHNVQDNVSGKQLLGDHFLVKNKDENLRIINIAFEDVVAFESTHNYVKIYIKDNRQITAYLSIQDVLDIVSYRKEFQQFHRAFIVSTRHISYIEGCVIQLSNNLQFNVGTKFKDVFNQYLTQRLLKTGRKS
jgi:DNA-binding LytR/AlgR family response regulator